MQRDFLKNIKIYNGTDVSLDMLKQALELDWRIYADEYHISEKQAKDYLDRNPYIYFVAVYNNRLIGYINFSPITYEIYEKIKSGIYIDTIIEKDDILVYEDNKTYFNYFSSIVIDKEYQKIGVGNKLLETVKVFIEKLKTERNITIKGIIADVLSEGGLKIVSKLGLKVIKESNHNSIIAEWKENYEK